MLPTTSPTKDTIIGTGGYLAACARRDGSVTCHECHAAAAGRVCLVTVSLRSLADLPADTVTPLASCPAPGRGRGGGHHISC